MRPLSSVASDETFIWVCLVFPGPPVVSDLPQGLGPNGPYRFRQKPLKPDLFLRSGVNAASCTCAHRPVNLGFPSVLRGTAEREGEGEGGVT